ncbi:MAG: hypothetical protein IOC90_13295 [Methylocystis sp.]|nr:hypothetical protein [Methylocystis sp.]MCA3588990.1 hypothetical protein [Methylocystis sp.]MCA3592378.1 hypothetical protein [Methylocystis sp.]
MKKFYGSVAVRISELRGGHIGRSGSPDALFGEPTRIIDGDRPIHVR